MDGLKIVYKDIAEVTPYEKNPRKNDQGVDAVARSIKEFGFKVPVILDGKGEIIAGHTRIKAAKQLGIEQIPCIIADDLTEAQIKAFRIADNKVAEFSEWDMDLLEIELQELSEIDFDMSLTGFDDIEIAEMMDIDSGDIAEDEVPEPPEIPITKAGDIWQLGRHRLLCGDATSVEDVSMLMDGQKADLILTDPPYNVDYEGGGANKLKIQNDKMTDGKFLQFLTDSFKQMYEHSKKGAAIYVFHADSEGYNFRTAFKQADYSLRQCLIWAKNSLVMGRQDYQWKHEPILYGWKDGASHAWYADRKQTTLIEYDRPQKSPEHPTMKPVGLCGYLIRNSSKEGDIVLDPFGGSGSTLIAAEQLSRICYMMELDPKYCDVIVKRYYQLVGSDANVLLVREGQTIPWKNSEMSA